MADEQEHSSSVGLIGVTESRESSREASSSDEEREGTGGWGGTQSVGLGKVMHKVSGVRVRGEYEQRMMVVIS